MQVKVSPGGAATTNRQARATEGEAAESRSSDTALITARISARDQQEVDAITEALGPCLATKAAAEAALVGARVDVTSAPSIRVEEAASPPSSFPTVYVAVGAGAGILLIIAIVVTCVCCCRRRGRATKKRLPKPMPVPELDTAPTGNLRSAADVPIAAAFAESVPPGKDRQAGSPVVRLISDKDGSPVKVISI